MAEEQAFQQCLGQSAAIDGQKQLVAPIAVRVQGESDQFLARAAVTGDQDSRLRIGNFFDQLQHIADRLALADDVIQIEFHRLSEAAPLRLTRGANPVNPCRQDNEVNVVRRPQRQV